VTQTIESFVGGSLDKARIRPLQKSYGKTIGVWMTMLIVATLARRNRRACSVRPSLCMLRKLGEKSDRRWTRIDEHAS
jgi:hypothetical protein